MKKKINQITETKLVNNDTGEIHIEKTDTSYQIDAEPAFIKLYLADILYLNDLQTNQAGLLFALLQKMNYDNQIVLNAAIKREIAKNLDISLGTLDNNLSKFCKGNVLKRHDRGVYIANPHLFGKGSWHQIYENRNANLDMTINYSEAGRTFNTVIKTTKKNNTEAPEKAPEEVVPKVENEIKERDAS